LTVLRWTSKVEQLKFASKNFKSFVHLLYFHI